MNQALEYSNFNAYPHYVYATAFLVDGKLADYSIGDIQKDWNGRTFRGSDWENKVFERLCANDKGLTCEYNKILVSNDKEHSNAFELLEMWLMKYEMYKHQMYFMNEIAERIEKKDETINKMADFIDEVDTKNKHCAGLLCTVATTCYPEEERKRICCSCIKQQFK